MKFRTTLKLLAASIAAAGMAASAQAADVKFGFAAPLTGPQSHYGEDMQNGLNLLGVSSYWQTLITGAIIVVSISVTAWSQHQNRSLL